jgi:hypothetical protein
MEQGIKRVKLGAKDTETFKITLPVYNNVMCVVCICWYKYPDMCSQLQTEAHICHLQRLLVRIL